MTFWESFGGGRNFYSVHKHTQISQTLFLGFHSSFPFYFTFKFFPEIILEVLFLQNFRGSSPVITMQFFFQHTNSVFDQGK